MYSTSSALIFSKTKNRSSGPTKKHTKLETIDELSSIEGIEYELKQEKDRLLKSGAKDLSEEYLALLEQRKRLDSSPRFVGGFPYSPTKHLVEYMPEDRRSPTNMRRSFLQQFPKTAPNNSIGTWVRKSKPLLVPMPSSEVLGQQEQVVVQEKMAFGLSALRSSFMQDLINSCETTSTEVQTDVQIASSADTAHSSVLGSSMESSQFSLSPASSSLGALGSSM